MKKQKSEKKVIEDFGKEWVHFDQSSISNLDKKKIFDDYFKIFPKKILNKHSIGFDAGCGTGRWSYFVAPLVKKMHCMGICSCSKTKTVPKLKQPFHNTGYNR